MTMNLNTFTEHPSSLNPVPETTSLWDFQQEPGVRLKKLPVPSQFDQSCMADQDYVIAKAQSQEKPFVVRWPRSKLPRPEAPDSSVIQVWEGKVLQVDYDKRVMQVLLEAKINQVPSHTGEIDLEWVSEQDIDLVCPGAIFYLTLSKRVKRSGIENTQELRFRRLPSWSKHQIAQIAREADMLLSKMKAAPIAE